MPISCPPAAWWRPRPLACAPLGGDTGWRRWGLEGEWCRRAPHSRGGPSLQDTASTASELVFCFPGRHLLFFNLLQFHSHLPGPSRSQHCLVKQVPWPIPSLLPPPLSQPPVPASLGCTRFQLHQQKFPFLPHFFFSLKARLSYHQNRLQMTGFNGLTRTLSTIFGG